MRRHIRHRGGSADPETERSKFYAVIEKTGEADEPSGPAHVLLQKLHHVGAAGDVFGGRIVAAGLSAQSQGGIKVARTFNSERVHGSTSAHRPGESNRVLDRRDDVIVRSAATQIAAHPLSDFLGRTSMPFRDASHARHDLSGRAV